MTGTFQEARAAVLASLRRPRTLLLPVAVLATGIGLSVAAFSVVQGVLLRGLPVEGGDRVVRLSTGPSLDRPSPLEDVEALRGAAGGPESAFEAVAASLALNFVLTGEGRATVGRVGAYVSKDLFPLLGVEPLLGRVLGPEDFEPGAEQVSVLGHALWRTVFGGDPAVLGQTLVVNRAPTTIVGVMPPRFGFPYRQELWTALRPEVLGFPATSAFVVARLAPGRTVEAARSELALLAGRLDEAEPLPQPRGSWVAPYAEASVDPATRRALRILVIAAGGVLLVACANAANLRLAAASARRQELEVRSALGAGRARLVVMLVAESAVIAALAAAGGLGIAWLLAEEAGRALLQGSLLRGYWMDVRVDGAVFAVTVLLATASVLLAGLIPALLAVRRGDAGATLRSGSRVGSGPSRGFVAVEVGLCFALVAGAAALGRNALELLGSEPGFEGAGLLTSRVSLFQNPERDGEGAAFYEELMRRLEARPEIERAAGGSAPPWGWGPAVEYAESSEGTGNTGRPGTSGPPETLPTVRILHAGPGYLQTVGLPLLAGRSITREDLAVGDRALVVSASFAARRLGGIDRAVGLVLDLRQGEWRSPARVVGVVADVGMARWQRDPSGDEQAYLADPLERGGISLLLRARDHEQAARNAVEEEVERLDRLAAVFDPSSFERDRAMSTWEQRRLSQLFLLFGVSALVLVAGGLYSVVDLAERRRARELALRLALGAAPGQVRRLVLREGLLHLVAGSGLGALALLALTPGLREFLVRAEVWDPWLLSGTLAVLALTVALAAAGPARRAARIDPAETLRSE